MNLKCRSKTFSSLVQFLEWLLLKVTEPSIIHDVIWQFNCALSEHPVQQMAAKMKAEGKGQKNSKVGFFSIAVVNCDAVM